MFKARIKLSNSEHAALTHTGFKGRTTRRGEAFITTDTEEAVYYQKQPAFVVTVLEGRIEPVGKKKAKRAPEPEVEEAEDEAEEEAPKGPAKPTYLRADLNKMKVDDLLALIEADENLKLERSDLPKKPSKAEIVSAIMTAQSEEDDVEDDEEVEDDEDEENDD